MPAQKFTKKANTAAKKRQWSHIEHNMLARGVSKKSAIMAANAALRDHPTRKKK